MRKDNVLRISIDDYYVEILLTKLPELPRKNVRKIFTLLHDPRNLFCADASCVAESISAWVQASKRAWENASRQYTNEWRLVNRRSRSAKNLEILKNNRRLKNNVKRAKARHDRWVALQAMQAEIEKGS